MTRLDYHGMRVLILGLGESGLSMARHLAPRGAVLSFADSRPAPPGAGEVAAIAPGATVHLGPFADAMFDGIDRVAISPGVPLYGPQTDPAVARARARGLFFDGDIELFAQALATENAENGYAPRIIAITGTNGKTTVTSLLAHLGQASGVATCAAGNIGPAVLDAWRDAKSAQAGGGALPALWVLELSSFQLETTASLKCDAAAVLNLSEDHLDRHGDMEAYARAKARIFDGAAVQVLNRDDARVMAMKKPFVPKRRRDVAPLVATFGAGAPAGPHDFGLVRESRPGGLTWLAVGGDDEVAPQRLMPVDALRLSGAHNAINVLAALALASLARLPRAPLLKALPRYGGLPHRVQRIAELDGVAWIDDSKGTNVGATQAALLGLGADLAPGRRIVLIAGGEGKGQDFAPLAAAVARHARAVLLIGRDAGRLRAALAGSAVALEDCADLGQAVRRAAQLARPGDCVLLSPACASFDMFRDYAHRAQVFAEAVRSLARPATPASVPPMASGALGAPPRAAMAAAAAFGGCDA
ncbi:MAG: UDP-N-acetylmuramoyl-L-alanine--D-glutamate ligase [Burkholderiales bacterium]|nr:UDP-N-acetylmuramoyl-L-alanine--D-glutamate ligase [Burkholderiales bacterium]